jgi:GDSL-like lipase/acylhydrolase family protein
VKRALVILAYVLAVLALFELGARWLLDPETFCKRFLCQDDATWRLRWVARHHGQPGLFYGFDAWDPRRGWALKPNVDRARDADGTVVTSNSHGLRSEKEIPLEKPPGEKRLLLLGDSFTFGAEVADRETFAAGLAPLLPGVEVLNLGVHGYGHDQMLLYLRDEGVKYSPDVVLVGFVGDDMLRNVLQFRDFAKPRFTLEGDRLMPHGIPVPSPEEVLREEPFRPKLLDLISIVRAQIGWSSGKSLDAAHEITGALLDAIAQTAQDAGAVPVFAYLPTAREVDYGQGRVQPDEQFLQDYCRARGAICLSLRPAFAAANARGGGLTRGAHWSPRGHEVAARALAEFLGARGLLRSGS